MAVGMVRKDDAAVTQFGPHGCIELSLSSAGSCVISTKCKAENTDNVEFAFRCVDTSGKAVKHTFGEGGFQAEESYDTEVECSECLAPTEVKTKKRAKKVDTVETVNKAPTSGAPSTAEESHALLSKFAESKKEEESTEGVPPSTASFYGPGGCVAAYRNKEGSCVMQTRCGGQGNISSYEFGMNCVDSEGEITRHLFGKNSFDSEETFDTLVKCSQCLGLDAEAPKGLDVLAKSVATLQDEMKEIRVDLKKIKDHITKSKPKTDEEEAPADSEEQEASDEQADADDDEEDAAATAAANEDVDDDGDDDAVFLRKTKTHHKRKAHVRRVTHKRHAKKPAVHHKREPKVDVVEDVDLDEPEIASY